MLIMNKIKELVSSGKIDAAITLCENDNSPVSRLIQGISRIGKPLADINTAIENAGRIEIYGLEKNVSVLATISCTYDRFWNCYWYDYFNF